MKTLQLTLVLFLFVVNPATGNAQIIPDSGFANNGVWQLPAFRYYTLPQPAITKDFIYSFRLLDAANAGYKKIELSRFFFSGKPDISFGQNGAISLAPPDSALELYWANLQVLSDSSIMCWSNGNYKNKRRNFIYHILKDGTTDGAFGNGGLLIIDLNDTLLGGNIAGIYLYNREYLVNRYIEFSSDYTPMTILYKMDAHGAVDNTFNIINFNFNIPLSYSLINDIKFMKNGNIVGLGLAGWGSKSRTPVLYQFDSAGNFLKMISLSSGSKHYYMSNWYKDGDTLLVRFQDHNNRLIQQKFGDTLDIIPQNGQPTVVLDSGKSNMTLVGISKSKKLFTISRQNNDPTKFAIRSYNSNGTINKDYCPFDSCAMLVPSAYSTINDPVFFGSFQAFYDSIFFLNYMWDFEKNFLLKLIHSISVSNSQLDVTIFPNPVHQDLTIALPKNAETSTVQIFDMVGKMVLSQSVKGESTHLDMRGLRPGSYLVRISTQAGTVKKHLLKL